MPETQTLSDMTADELRIEIAAAKGFTRRSGIWADRPGTTERVVIPDYPRDPAAALGLLEELANAGLDITISNKGCPDWRVYVYRHTEDVSTDVKANRGEFCHVICRAWLEAHRRGWLHAA